MEEFLANPGVGESISGLKLSGHAAALRIREGQGHVDKRQILLVSGIELFLLPQRMSFEQNVIKHGGVIQILSGGGTCSMIGGSHPPLALTYMVLQNS